MDDYTDLERRLDLLDRDLDLPRDSAVPNSAVPNSAVPNSAVPNSAEPATAPQPRTELTHLPEPRVPGDEGLAERTDRRPADHLIAALERRLHRLEQLAWGTDGNDLTELDLADPELVELAVAAEYAQTLSRMLVTPRLRAACEQTIEACRQWQQRYDYARDTAVAASRTIATTRADQERHREAAQVFEAARAELAVLLPRRRRTLNTAHNARRQLAHDQGVRERYGREIAEGHRAWATLTTRLRIRTSAAVERGEPLPNWLVESLGVPPSAKAAGWRELAVQLLAYRLSYAVTDPGWPLGTEPGTQDSTRRRQWYRDLDRQLTSWCSGAPGSI
ncbi:hypothetical protein ACTXG6_27375 [Pseudonocardia sp. Cha107L01]|uniref:hypothetical protein n=1 Tax=Pseudonocardia sp. Cha107L01 TaxID=3457576 RepID=UPI00403ED8D7